MMLTLIKMKNYKIQIKIYKKKFVITISIAIFANNCILESNYIMIKCAKNAMILIIRKELKLVI